MQKCSQRNIKISHFTHRIFCQDANKVSTVHSWDKESNKYSPPFKFLINFGEWLLWRDLMYCMYVKYSLSGLSLCASYCTISPISCEQTQRHIQHASITFNSIRREIIFGWMNEECFKRVLILSICNTVWRTILSK